MKSRNREAAAAAVLSLCALLGSTAAQAVPYQITEVMSGLVTPRGLAFAPDGALYVAEAGSGGNGPSVILGNGKTAFMGYTGGVSRLAGGVQTRVLSGLPSLAPAGGAEGGGLHDIVFDAGVQAYGLFGLGSAPAQRNSLGAFGASLFGTVARLSLDGTGQVSAIADIAQHEAAANPDGGALDTNPYGLARTADGRFLVADAGGNSFLQGTGAGAVSTVGVLAPKPNPLPFGPPVYQSVPTSLAIGPDGQYYVGELTGFPFPAGAANVYRHDPIGGTTTVAYGGFTNIVDLGFDASGNLYVLQISSNGLASPAGPGSGLLLKIDGQTGQRTTIASDGLVFPGGLAIEEGPNGPIFYVTNYTAGPVGGAVLRISPVPEPGTWALMLGGLATLAGVARRRRATGRVAG